MNTEALIHTAFYKFVRIEDTDAAVIILRELTQDLTGSILVASEGINGMLAASEATIDRFEYALQNDPRFKEAFIGIAFKRSPCKTVPFGKMKVHKKRKSYN